jgi:dipeptidase E
MQTILLTSAGMQVKNEILKILPRPARWLKLAYVVTAANVVTDKSYAERDRKLLVEAGFQIEDLNIDGKQENDLRQFLEEKDVIYVQGGNAFYLLKCARESGFDNIVRELVENGTIYIGASAGSYIACPTIEMAAWKHQDQNRFGLQDLTGLELVPFLISAHYEEKYKNILKDAIKHSQFPVKILTDKQAILIKDGNAQLVGEGDEVRL